MNEQNIIDALDNLASEIKKLKVSIKDLNKTNAELRTQVYELKEYVSTL